jgi:ankyrin repeat protein
MTINSYTSPLALGVLNDYYDIVFLLLYYGANPNVRYGLYEKTLLHVAIENEFYDIVEILIDSGADVNALDNKYNNAL